MKFGELIPSKMQVELRYSGDFFVTLNYIDETLARKIRESVADGGGSRRRILDSMDPEKLPDAYAEYGIGGWKGLENDDGTPTPCSQENKRKIMHANLDFQRWVMEETQNTKNFLDRANQEEEKKYPSGLLT